MSKTHEVDYFVVKSLPDAVFEIIALVKANQGRNITILIDCIMDVAKPIHPRDSRRDRYKVSVLQDNPAISSRYEKISLTPEANVYANQGSLIPLAFADILKNRLQEISDLEAVISEFIKIRRSPNLERPNKLPIAHLKNLLALIEGVVRSSEDSLEQRQNFLENLDICFSAKDGEGIKKLRNKLANIAVSMLNSLSTYIHFSVQDKFFPLVASVTNNTNLNNFIDALMDRIEAGQGNLITVITTYLMGTLDRDITVHPFEDLGIPMEIKKGGLYETEFSIDFKYKNGARDYLLCVIAALYYTEILYKECKN